MTSPLFQRICWAKENLKPVHSKYRVIFEDPDNFEGPMMVLVPAPEWMAMALHGGLLPPIQAYLEDKAVTEAYEREHGSQEGFKWSENGGAKHPYAKPIGPMTEEQAIEYLILKDIPSRVYEYQGNRTILKIVPVELVPTDRSYRDAWTIKQEAA